MNHLIPKNPYSLGQTLFLIILFLNIFRVCAFCSYFYAVNVTAVYLASPALLVLRVSANIRRIFSILYVRRRKIFHFKSATRPFIQTSTALVYWYITEILQLT
jgi:hypothetical protein